jgi:hypothetical protein
VSDPLRYLQRIRDCTIVPEGKEDDLELMRSKVVLANIWATAGLIPDNPSVVAPVSTVSEGDS